jgi:hypothetical protein
MSLVITQNEKMCWTICKEKTMPLTSLWKTPFRTGLQNGEEGEHEVEEDEVADEALLAKCETKSMALAEQGGDLNKIRRSRQTTLTVIRGADDEGEEV